MNLDEILEVQELVKGLYDEADVIGIADDNVHLRTGRFIEEFNGDCAEYCWVDDPESVANGEFHLNAYYNDMKFVTVFNDYDMDDLYQKVENSELRADLRERFGDPYEEN